jgi:hypothetical protein
MPYKDWDSGIQQKHIRIRRRLSVGKNIASRGRRTTSASASIGTKAPSLRLLQLRYHLNSLRVLTFLARMGFPRPWAMPLARWWEGVRHPWARASR